MASSDRVVFLFDVDNTLVDNDFTLPPPDAMPRLTQDASAGG